MDVSTTVWAVTIVAIAGLLLFDYVFHVRKAHEPQLKEAAIWSAIYVGLALLFGLFVLVEWGGRYAGEYHAGYITEKALSVDNLFVFLIIIASFKVPRADQQKVLLFGIIFALIARTALIFVGAGLINQFSWVFYAFGPILLRTAGSLIKGELSESGHDEADNFVVRLAKRFIHTTDHYDGDKLFTVHNGKRATTPPTTTGPPMDGPVVVRCRTSSPRTTPPTPASAGHSPTSPVSETRPYRAEVDPGDGDADRDGIGEFDFDPKS